MSSDGEDSNKTIPFDSDQELEPEQGSIQASSQESEQDSSHESSQASSPSQLGRARSPLSMSPDETDTHPLCAYMTQHGAALVVELGKRDFSTMYGTWMSSTANRWYHEMITGAIEPPVFDPNKNKEEKFNHGITELFRKWRSENPGHALPKYNVDEHV